MSRSRQDGGPLLQVEMFVSTNGGTGVLSQTALSDAVEVSNALLASRAPNLVLR